MQLADFFTPAFFADPYPLYERVRAEGPFVEVMPQMWMTGSYATAEALLKDRRWGKEFLDFIRMQYGEERVHERCFQMLHRSIFMMNPPDHTHLKALLMKAFNAKQISELKTSMQATADALIDKLTGNSTPDVMKNFAVPLPLTILCMFFELNEEETDFFVTQGAAITRPIVRMAELTPMAAQEIDAANSAVERLEVFFRKKLEERRKSPGKDLLTRMLTVEENGLHLTEEEIIASIILTFVAGHETTSFMIGNALIGLYRNPDQLALLRSDESLVPQCVGECLRYDASVHLLARNAMEDMEFQGMNFSKGATIGICLGAINRDPQRFDEPNRLLIQRPERKALPFGGGAHYCIGAMMGIAEIEIALRTLLRRLPNLQLTNLDDLQWLPSHAFRGVQSLRAEW